MSRKRIDQIMAGFGDGDAISNAAVIIRDALRELGYDSDIYAPPDRVSPSLRGACRPLNGYNPPGDAVSIYHYGIASPATRVFLAAETRKIIIYHNITPPEYFDGFEDSVAEQLRGALTELAEVAGKAKAVWAVSNFNSSELNRMGVGPAHIFELPFSPAPLDFPPDPEIRVRLSAPLKTILFVGRIAPNKRVEDLIQAFAWYHKTIDPHSRVVIIGSNRSCPRYYTMLRMMTGDLDIPNICFEGFASPGGLATYYQLADLYLNTSEHEGYCLPLLEAMYKGLPVVSRSVGGVPEAMGGAGVRYEDLSHREVAELVHLVLSDERLRNEVLEGQRERVRRALSRNIAAELRSLLDASL